VIGLLAANACYFAIGACITRRLGLAYIAGVAAVGIATAHLALVHVPIGLLELVVVAVALLLYRWRRRPIRPVLPGPPGVAAGVLLVLVLALLVQAAAAFAVRPLIEWDGWAIWAMKARALFDFGGAQHDVFTTAPYAPLQHPLLLPSLEATGFRAIGSYDGTLIHLQLALLALGFAVGLWTLLRERVAAPLAAVAVFAIVAAESVLRQLAGNLADIPLALFVALGLVCLGRWVLEHDRGLLALAALFLGAATLTKPEGLLFAAAALLAATVAWRRDLLWGALGVVAIYAPWRIFVAAHGLQNQEYSLGDALRPSYLADRSERLRPALSGVWHQVWASGWSWLVPFALVSLAAALLARKWRLSAFAVVWAVLSFCGIVLVFWISVVPIQLTLLWAAYRTVASLVIGAAALAPVLAGEAWRTTRIRAASVERSTEPSPSPVSVASSSGS
jgi:dolichyl-phosphate-mannose-protein mannosyltransferase